MLQFRQAGQKYETLKCGGWKGGFPPCSLKMQEKDARGHKEICVKRKCHKQIYVERKCWIWWGCVRKKRNTELDYAWKVMHFESSWVMIRFCSSASIFCLFFVHKIEESVDFVVDWLRFVRFLCRLSAPGSKSFATLGGMVKQCLSCFVHSRPEQQK